MDQSILKRVDAIVKPISLLHIGCGNTAEPTDTAFHKSSTDIGFMDALSLEICFVVYYDKSRDDLQRTMNKTIIEICQSVLPF